MMVEDGESSLLTRKIAAGVLRPDPHIMTPERAFHVAFAKSSEKLMKLPVRTPGYVARKMTGQEIADTLPDHALLLLTEGPDEGVGLVAMSPEALACLIEVMTLGGLADHPPAPRRPTRTDAAMVTGFVDEVLTEFEELLAQKDDVIWAGGFRYHSHLPDPRPLALILEEQSYRTFRLRLAFGLPSGPEAEDRAGDIILVFPAQGRGAAPVHDDAEIQAQEASTSHPEEERRWEATLEHTVQQIHAEVTAVLARICLPLSDVLQLEAGISLPMPMSSLSAIQLEGSGGQLLCYGRLGQGNGHRALRIDPPADPEELVPLPVIESECVGASEQPLTRAVAGAPADILPARPAGLTPEGADDQGHAHEDATEQHPPQALAG